MMLYAESPHRSLLHSVIVFLHLNVCTPTTYSLCIVTTQNTQNYAWLLFTAENQRGFAGRHFAEMYYLGVQRAEKRFFRNG